LAPPLDPRRACGARPIDGLLVAARRRRLAPELLDLRSSGDTAGDRRQVVGYGAFAFRAAA
jgi:MEMO1 family protein